ncbi:hypothetical protein Pelo_8010 [Pelomyxa schiedti]|nr:hypothetical protein Pelo_8010 [Pelomyxa schiedti]
MRDPRALLCVSLLLLGEVHTGGEENWQHGNDFKELPWYKQVHCHCTPVHPSMGADSAPTKAVTTPTTNTSRPTQKRHPPACLSDYKRNAVPPLAPKWLGKYSIVMTFEQKWATVLFCMGCIRPKVGPFSSGDTPHFFGNGYALMLGTRPETVAVANLRTNVMREVAAPGFAGKQFFGMFKGKKWVVLWEYGATIVILSVDGMQEERNSISGGNHHARRVEVGKNLTAVEMISDDEAVVVVTSEGGLVEVLCVDLKLCFESGKLVIRHRFQGFPHMGSQFFHMKKHKLIGTRHQRNSSNFQWVSLSPLHNTDVELHHSVNPMSKVDGNHFAEHDKDKGTLSVFSTDDFDQPVRIFHLNRMYCCENGFIVFWYERHLDLVDAVTGTWLLRQPLCQGIHRLSLGTS